MNYSCSPQPLVGTGNITGDPLFVNGPLYNFNLQVGSPCIDTGDPGSPLDPDSTRADMGALYFDQSTPSVSIMLEPVNPPIIIPASGGSFSFDATLHNNESTSQTFDVWIMIHLPNSVWYGPALGPITLTLPANLTLVRLRTQTVPATAPVGAYWYQGRVGDYPSAISDSSGFPFGKSATGDGMPIGDWANSGPSFNDAVEASNANHQALITSISPNPFNPTTTLRFMVAQPGETSLSIYDLQGRRVAQLFSGNAETGSHSVTFSGRDLPSGVYLARLSSSGTVSVSKLLLTK